MAILFYVKVLRKLSPDSLPEPSLQYRIGSVIFQYQDIPLIWIKVGQGLTVLAVGAGSGCLDIFLLSIISLFFLPVSRRLPEIDRNTVSKGC